MVIDLNRLKRYCPKCKSYNILKTELYKQAFDLKKQTRREYRKFICKDCKEEFWK